MNLFTVAVLGVVLMVLGSVAIDYVSFWVGLPVAVIGFGLTLREVE